jgi:hypothetical protein
MKRVVLVLACVAIIALSVRAAEEAEPGEFLLTSMYELSLGFVCVTTVHRSVPAPLLFTEVQDSHYLVLGWHLEHCCCSYHSLRSPASCPALPCPVSAYARRRGRLPSEVFSRQISQVQG